MERPYTSRPHLWSERPSFDWNGWHVLPVCLTIINGERGLMKSSRKSRIFYISCEGWLRNLTQYFVHGIVPQAFARRNFVPTSMVVLLFIGKGLVGWSSGSPSITSTIRFTWEACSFYGEWACHIGLYIIILISRLDTWISIYHIRGFHLLVDRNDDFKNNFQILEMKFGKKLILRPK